MIPEEKRRLFFESNTDIKAIYDSILQINDLGGYNVCALENIKRFALENSPFYSKYTMEDNLPIITKVDLIEHYDEIFCPIFKGKSLHKMSTSGSTGIPFSVEQDIEKRRRVIAELKVYGLYANESNNIKGKYRKYEFDALSANVRCNFAKK